MDSPVTPDRLRSHVETLAGHIGERNVFRPERLDAAAAYIEDQWRIQGYEVVRQTYDVRGVSCSNLEVTRRGSVDPNEITLVGAHYDSVYGSPGANDNASGVASMLETSRLFRDRAPERTVRFVAFVNEEPPFFPGKEMGSRVYARAARRRGDDIRLMLSLETLGCYEDAPGSQQYPPLFGLFYPDRGNFVAFVSDLRSRGNLRRFVRAFKAASNFPAERVATFSFVPGVSWSDHSSFWKQGYRALMVTDTAFYRYAHYHTALDTPDRVCYEPLAEVTRGLFSAIARGTGAEGRPWPASTRS